MPIRLVSFSYNVILSPTLSNFRINVPRLLILINQFTKIVAILSWSWETSTSYLLLKVNTYPKHFVQFRNREVIYLIPKQKLQEHLVGFLEARF